MIFLFPRWDMLISWRVIFFRWVGSTTNQFPLNKKTCPKLSWRLSFLVKQEQRPPRVVKNGVKRFGGGWGLRFSFSRWATMKSYETQTVGFGYCMVMKSYPVLIGNGSKPYKPWFVRIPINSSSIIESHQFFFLAHVLVFIFRVHLIYTCLAPQMVYACCDVFFVFKLQSTVDGRNPAAPGMHTIKPLS